MSGDWSLEELRACVIAREIRDGERGFLGANIGVGRAAMLLAHRLHAPNLRVPLGFGWTNLDGERRFDLHDDATDPRDGYRAEGWMRLDEMISSYRFFADFFIIGALQIDRFGNSNLIGIGDDHRRLKVRGPGAMGSVSSTAFCDRFYLVPSRHEPRVLVERCDFISAPGWGEGGRDGREKLGLPGGGPHLCVTPLCVFDFENDQRAMRLRSVHPGVSVDEVLAATGFEPIVPQSVPETEPPSDEELALLRELIDPAGALRGL